MLCSVLLYTQNQGVTTAHKTTPKWKSHLKLSGYQFEEIT